MKFINRGIKLDFFVNLYEAKTVHWIGAQFCVCIFLDSGDKSFNM